MKTSFEVHCNSVLPLLASFFADPEDHIHMHFPDDPQWQLLDRTVTAEQFIDQPVVKSYLFQYGLKVPSTFRSTIGEGFLCTNEASPKQIKT